MILLPPAAVSGWSPEQVEMALLHELAHVRRWDNLVNLVQRVVEGLLFFHPAVWLVSRWLRADREQCCDAIVVAHTGAPEAYAELLVRVARVSTTGRLPSAAVALTTHPLTRRVRRILQLEDDPMLVSKRTLSLVALSLVVVVGVALWQGQSTSVAKDGVAPAPFGVSSADTSLDQSYSDHALWQWLQATPMIDDIREIALSGHLIRLEVAENGRFQFQASQLLAEKGPPKQYTKTDAADFLLHMVFAPSPDNGMDSRTHSVPPKYQLSQESTWIEEMFDSWKKAPSGTQVDFEWSWTDQGQRIRLKAPKAAQWLVSQMMQVLAEESQAGKVASTPVEVIEDLTTEITENTDEQEEEDDILESKATPSTATNSPFLPLEQQRIADVAYKMLSVEVARVDEQTQKAINEKGFAGGVRLEGSTSNGGFGGGEHMHFQPGDILVGLHVWPTKDFDQLGEVLRRDDLDQFNPLKYYVLREVPDKEATRECERQRELDRQKEKQELMESFGVSKGGEFGGGGFGGEFGGRRASRDRERPEQTEPIPTKLELVTGRMTFDEGAWAEEQNRLKQAMLPSEPAKVSPELNAEGPADPLAASPGNGANAQSEFVNKGHTYSLWASPSNDSRKSPKLLYDGRTFEDWRDAFATELKTEKRVEAIKALRTYPKTI